MDSTHVHLLLNHFPIMGTLIGTFLLLYGVVTRNENIQKVSMATIFAMALLAIPVFLTGEPAEERVENLPGVIESIIQEHEEAAEIAFWSMISAGVVSFITMLMQMFQHKRAKAFVIGVMVLGLVTSGLMVRTGYLGGQIRHTELRGNVPVNLPVEQSNAKEEDDD